MQDTCKYLLCHALTIITLKSFTTYYKQYLQKCINSTDYKLCFKLFSDLDCFNISNEHLNVLGALLLLLLLLVISIIQHDSLHRSTSIVVVVMVTH